MANPQSFRITSFTGGLNTENRPTALPPGSAQDGSQNFWLDRGSLQSSPGFTKLTKELVDDYTYRLDGQTQYLRGEITATGSNVAGGAGPATIMVVFRVDAVPNELSAYLATVQPLTPYAAIAYKGGPRDITDFGEVAAATDFDWGFFVTGTPNGLSLSVAFGTGPGFLEVGPLISIELGKYYFAAIVVPGGGGDVEIHAGELGGAVTSQTGPFVPPVTALQDTADSSLTFGAVPRLDPDEPDDHGALHLNGIVQEFRVYDAALSPATMASTIQTQLVSPASEPNLVAYYWMTGLPTNSYYVEPSVGTAGTGASESPVLSLLPRDATWRTDGHILGNPMFGDASIDLNGITQGLVIPDPYRYRKLEPNDIGEMDWPTYFALSLRVKPRTLKDRATIWQFSHIPDIVLTSHKLTESTNTGSFGTLDMSNLLLETVDTGAGAFRFRAVVFTTAEITGEVITVNGSNNLADTLTRGAKPGTVIITFTTAAGGNTVVVQDDGAGAFTKISGTGTISTSSINYTSGALALDFSAAIDAASATANYTAWSATSEISANNLAAGTEYTVTVGTNFSDIATGGVLSILVDNDVEVTETCPTDARPPNSPELNLDLDTGTSRKYHAVIGRAINEMRQIANLPNNPDDIEVKYAFDRCFDGEIKQVVLAHSESSFGAGSLHGVVRDEQIDRRNTTNFGVPIVSCWTMNEGAGEIIEDIGLLGNPIYFDVDPGHVFGLSGVSTVVRRGAVGGFDQRYRSPTGEVRRVCAIASGSIYEVTPSTGALTWLADGIRNENDAVPSVAKFQDSTIICLQDDLIGPWQFWKDQLYRLSIEPPKGPIPWGFDNQGNREAGLRRGEPYRYAFTFYSAHTGKRSPATFLEVMVRFKRADVKFGLAAEINQTQPTSGPSVNKAPYDGSTSGTKIGFSSWYGGTTTNAATDPDWYETQPGTSGANTNAAPLRKVNLTSHPTFADNEAITEDELQIAVDQQNNRVFVRVLGDDRVEFRGAYQGSKARLWLQDDISSTPVVAAGGIIDFGATAAGEVYTGTGTSGHNIPLPSSTDPQVTHLEIWRTVSGGGSFFLIERIPNGTRSYTDNRRDPDLGGREVLDINRGQVPPCRHVIPFAGRYFYFGNRLAPYTLYESDIGQPWNVPPQNTTDFLDGTTLAITGAAATENVLILFKNDTTFLISETGNPSFPFRVQVRFRDVGCVAPFGIVNVREIFHFPDEQGFFGYDTTQLGMLSEQITPTWEAVRAGLYSQIIGVHDKKNRAILWFYPSGETTVGEETVNDRALVYFYEQGAWSLLTGLYVKYAFEIGDVNDTNQVWIVDPLGYISVWDMGTNFGVGTLTTRSVAIASFPSSITMTVPQANLSNLPEGYKGLPVVVEANGVRYMRYAIGDTLASPSVVRLNEAIPGVLTTGTAHFGSIEFDWISGEMLPAGQDKLAQMLSVHVVGTPQSTASNFEVRYLAKHGIDPVACIEGSYTMSNQRNERMIASDEMSTAGYGRRHRMRFRALGPDRPLEIRSAAIWFNADSGGMPGDRRDDE